MCVCVCLVCGACVCLGAHRGSFVHVSKMKRELWLLNMCATGCDSGQFSLLHRGTSDGLEFHVVMSFLLQWIIVTPHYSLFSLFHKEYLFTFYVVLGTSEFSVLLLLLILYYNAILYFLHLNFIVLPEDDPEKSKCIRVLVFQFMTFIFQLCSICCLLFCKSSTVALKEHDKIPFNGIYI